MIKKYRVTYQFTRSSFCFQNSVTVDAISEEQASDKGMAEISMCYGSGMTKYFKIIRVETLKTNSYDN